MSIKKTYDLINKFSCKGFHYSKDIIFDYYLSLITKPFVILTGISGSGKSKIAEIFAEIIGNDDSKSYELIPVKPNWRDNKGLFGYHNLIDGGYYLTPMIKLFLRALADKENPYFLILDEMNIAKTEHYFADYLSLIESRRVTEKNVGSSLADLQEIFRYDTKVTLSEAIILAALDINKPGVALKIEDYRMNRFSELWKSTFYGGNNWTAQYRSELNQGINRLANRVFEKVADGKYRLQDKSSLSGEDAAIVTKLERMYSDIFKGKSITQDNIVLHNCSKCIDENGVKCKCDQCPYVAEERYKCEKLYDKANEHYFVPSELPIPLNVFTIGTVNVDETTYMFSPKVLDRSNVIEFNEVDFGGLYNLSPEQISLVEAASRMITNPDFYFDVGTDMPSMRITLPSAESVNDFASKCPEEFDVLIRLFAVLKKHNMHFGYRVMNEISCYMCNAIANTTYVDREKVAFDNQILQKVLPKIYGSYDKIWNPLVELLGELLNTREDYSGLDADALVDKLKQTSGGTIKSLELNGTTAKTYFKYPKSAIKIVEMLEDLELAGFATYIK
ncbi:AAA family ATPase [Acetivibrio ethanolgignens]|uniref:ATPase dynein-related AAA domain-containing protein n=1 Tax=Acetivibrio ethanolgignens TaxID=290052 RepID=A0A0V8QER4_9FIRM|nr:AAA family ATPase [Acetivibrio ethanolgignens]KSV58726.1 hypothetical protein ASU35_12005 [Acetivibrio ethanolgignens]